MIRFSPSMTSDGVVRFLPATNTVDSVGDTLTTYPTPYDSSGVTLAANIQFKPLDEGRIVTRDGIVQWNAIATVCFLDDPSSLNGGKGIRRMDAIWWSLDGRLLVCQCDAVKLRTVWRVLCLATE